MGFSITRNVLAVILVRHVQSTFLPMLATTTFVKLVFHQVRRIVISPFMLMIDCEMVKVVVQLTHAAHSTIHNGFVNNYLMISQLVLI